MTTCAVCGGFGAYEGACIRKHDHDGDTCVPEVIECIACTKQQEDDVKVSIWVATGAQTSIESVKLYRATGAGAVGKEPEITIRDDTGLYIAMSLATARWLHAAIGKCLTAAETADPQQTRTLHEEKP